MQTRTLVTGGSGFIGTNLVDALLRDSSSVVNLDVAQPLDERQRHHWIRGSVLERDTVEAIMAQFRPHRVVHLAARADLDDRGGIGGYEVNYLGTDNVLRESEAIGGVKRVVVASTMLVCSLGRPPTGDTDYSPQTVYGESKMRGELVTRQIDIDATWTVVRPTTVWGPWQIRSRDQFLKRLASRTYIHPSGVSARRAYGYVGNVVHQILGLMSAPREATHRRTFYVGDAPIDLIEYVNEFSLALSGRTVRRAPRALFTLAGRVGDILDRFGRPGFPLTTYRVRNMTEDNVLDVTPVKNLTGGGPCTLQEGVDRTVEWSGLSS